MCCARRKVHCISSEASGRGLFDYRTISVLPDVNLSLKIMEMAGVKNSVITCESPEKVSRAFWRGILIKLLVDAPCSGEGMFRREPSMVKSWSPEEVERYAKLQREILTSAAQMIKPGGYLLYSTCTFAKEEDEQTVEYFFRAT